MLSLCSDLEDLLSDSKNINDILSFYKKEENFIESNNKNLSK